MTPTDHNPAEPGDADRELDRRAALAMGWTREDDGYWQGWFRQDGWPVREWEPSTDLNDARRLVEECGRRGLEQRFSEALADLACVDVHPLDPLGIIWAIASATAEQITRAAVGTLEGAERKPT